MRIFPVFQCPTQLCHTILLRIKIPAFDRLRKVECCRQILIIDLKDIKGEETI
jgi:hypothetical protein